MPPNIGGQSFNSRYDLIVQDEEKMAKPEFKFPVVAASSHYSKFSQNHYPHHLPSRYSTSISQEAQTSTTKLNQPPPPSLSKPTHRHLSLSQFKRLTLQPLNRPTRSIRSHFRNLSLTTPIITLPDHSTTSTTPAQSSLAPLRFHRHHPHPSDTTSVSCITKIDTASGSRIHPLPSPQPDPIDYQRLKSPRIRSLSTISNLNSSNHISMNSERPYSPTRHQHHHSFSEVPLNKNDPYENENGNGIPSDSSSDLHKDLVSRQLWEELEQELGEKIEFPSDVMSTSQSSSPISQQFHSITTSPRVPSYKPHSTLSNELQPSSSKRNINLSSILQANTPRGIASELRESMATPKPRRPSVPAPRELISQISTAIPPIQLDPSNNPVDTARTALHNLPLHLQSNDPRRESTASSEISLSAIFGNDTDSLEDLNDLEGLRKSQDARLSATLSTSSQLSINPSNPSSSSTRPRYLSGESTCSEHEVSTPNDIMMHSLASSVKTSSIEPLNASLDGLHLHQTDEMNEARELIDDSWVASTLPSIKPIIPLGSQHTRRQAKASQSPVLVSGEIPISFTPNFNLSSHPSHKTRHTRRGSQPFRHAPHPSTSSIGSMADSQRACSYASTITNATSNFDHQASYPISLSRSKEANTSRILKAQSAPPGSHGKIQHSRVSSVISQVSVPNSTNNNTSIPEKLITTRRKRSASASVPRQRYSPPTSSLPEIPKDHLALQTRPSLDFKSHSGLTEFPKSLIRPCPPPPLPSLPLPPPPSIKLVPITRTLRRQRSQPTLDFTNSKPIIPSPLNLLNLPSTPPSPDRFKFAELPSTSSNHHHKKIIDRSIFKDIFSNSSKKDDKIGTSSGMNRLRSLSTSKSRLPFHHSRNKSELNLIGNDFLKSNSIHQNQNIVKSTFED